jgi:hypothetical protein
MPSTRTRNLLARSGIFSLADAASNATSVPCGDETACGFIGTEIGITSTPVIDVDTKTLYVSAFTKENATYVYRMHALDLASGSEKFGGPIMIQGSVPGTGAGSDGTNVAFNAHQHLQRSALLLNNGVVYIAFASFADRPPYHGWIFGYDSQTLQPRAMLNLSPNGSDAGIWGSGGGLDSERRQPVYRNGKRDFRRRFRGTRLRRQLSQIRASR